jgi:peptidoglycan/xylan/chitin deacetylase (PgdA/CDA1 family)
MTATTILTYHSLDTSGSVVSLRPALFAEHMAVLGALGFRGISLDEAVAHREQNGSWPVRSVALTFDDGFANFHEEALPVLARHGFTATVFLVTGHVGARNDWARPPDRLGDRPMLTWKQVRDAADAGIEIGAHTRTHPDLRALAPDRAADELRSSREEIEARMGAKVTSFAYPYGLLDDSTTALVRREYRAACTTVLRRAGADDVHLLPRIDAYYVPDARELERIVTGERDTYLALRRVARGVRSKLPL